MNNFTLRFGPERKKNERQNTPFGCSAIRVGTARFLQFVFDRAPITLEKGLSPERRETTSEKNAAARRSEFTQIEKGAIRRAEPKAKA